MALPGAPARFGEWAAVSYDGGGSVGARAYLVSAILGESTSHHNFGLNERWRKERVNECPSGNAKTQCPEPTCVKRYVTGSRLHGHYEAPRDLYLGITNI